MGEKIRLSLCMIVRNEEDCLARCLKSVDSVVDEIVIVDTGSTDKTMEIAQQYGARLFQIRWPGDFAEARNFVLAKARGEWILVLDADEELDSSSRELLLETITDPNLDGVISILTDYNNTIVTAQVCRLFRSRPDYRFEGTIHEQIINSILRNGGKVVKKKINIFHYGYQKENVINKFKRARNISLLEGLIAAGKADYTTYYHLGREFQRLGDPQKAISLYQRSFEIRPALENLNTHDLLRRLADCLIDINELDQAIEIIKPAQEAYPDFTDLFFIEAKIHEKQKNWEQARHCLCKCIELGDAPPQYTSLEGTGSYLALESLGHIAFAESKHEEALGFYHQALTTSPQKERLIARIVELNIILHGPEDAFDFVTENNYLENQDLAQSIAGIFAKNKAYTFALSSIGGIPIEGLSEETQQVAVYCQVHRGNYDLAAEIASSLLNTRFEELALTALCLHSIQRNDFCEAQRLASELLERNNSNDGFWVLSKLLDVLNNEVIYFESKTFNLVQIQEIVEFIIKIGDLKVSQALVSEVLSKILTSSELALVLGKVWFNIGELKEAAELLIQAYNDGVYDSESLKMLGYIAEKEGFHEEAYLFYREGLRAR